MSKMIQNPVKKETVHQFHVGCMTHPTQKKHRTHRGEVINLFESAFKPVTVKSIKNYLKKCNISVI